MREASWRYHPNISKVDPSSATHILPLQSMYMGAQVSLYLQKDIFKDRSRQSDVLHFLKCVQDFYIESCIQIKERFPLGDSIMKMLQVLHPNTTIGIYPSLAPLLSRFDFIIPPSSIEKLDAEWCRLSMVDLPFDKNDMDPDTFWGQLDDITDGLGNPHIMQIYESSALHALFKC